MLYKTVIPCYKTPIMKNKISRWTLFVIALMLQSCTIASYEIRNKLVSSEDQNNNEPCEIKYFLSVSSGYCTNTYGISYEHRAEVLNSLKNQYIKATNEIFGKKGCLSSNVENERDANFKIKVERLRQLSALPQEYLTGLSFGIIPSWGTREGELKYSFIEESKRYTYYIDTHAFNHIILFPVFWIMFITLDEDAIYRESITNFIESATRDITSDSQ